MATYAEWLWAEHEGQATPQEIFEASYAAEPAESDFWAVTIGDPGVEDLFHDATYVRGAMTLQALRLAVGDDAFWEIVRRWAATYSGGNVTTEQFIGLAEEVSGQQLDDLFDTWLYTPTRPELPGGTAPAEAATAVAPTSGAPSWAPVVRERLERGRY